MKLNKPEKLDPKFDNFIFKSRVFGINDFKEIPVTPYYNDDIVEGKKFQSCILPIGLEGIDLIRERKENITIKAYAVIGDLILELDKEEYDREMTKQSFYYINHDYMKTEKAYWQSFEIIKSSHQGLETDTILRLNEILEEVSDISFISSNDDKLKFLKAYFNYCKLLKSIRIARIDCALSGKKVSQKIYK